MTSIIKELQELKKILDDKLGPQLAIFSEDKGTLLWDGAGEPYELLPLATEDGLTAIPVGWTTDGKELIMNVSEWDDEECHENSWFRLDLDGKKTKVLDEGQDHGGDSTKISEGSVLFYSYQDGAEYYTIDMATREENRLVIPPGFHRSFGDIIFNKGRMLVGEKENKRIVLLSSSEPRFYLDETFLNGGDFYDEDSVFLDLGKHPGRSKGMYWLNLQSGDLKYINEGRLPLVSPDKKVLKYIDPRGYFAVGQLGDDPSRPDFFTHLRTFRDFTPYLPGDAVFTPDSSSLSIVKPHNDGIETADINTGNVETIIKSDFIINDHIWRPR